MYTCILIDKESRKMGLLSMIASAFGFSKKEARILVIGLDNSGKTTILKKLSEEDILHVMPTQGFNIKSLKHGNFKLNMWDVGGQKTIRPYWRNYFESTDGIIWVVDSVDPWRLEDCRAHLKDILSQEKLAGASLLIFANKQDLGKV